MKIDQRNFYDKTYTAPGPTYHNESAHLTSNGTVNKNHFESPPLNTSMDRGNKLSTLNNGISIENAYYLKNTLSNAQNMEESSISPTANGYVQHASPAQRSINKPLHHQTSTNYEHETKSPIESPASSTFHTYHNSTKAKYTYDKLNCVTSSTEPFNKTITDNIPKILPQDSVSLPHHSIPYNDTYNVNDFYSRQNHNNYYADKVLLLENNCDQKIPQHFDADDNHVKYGNDGRRLPPTKYKKDGDFGRNNRTHNTSSLPLPNNGYFDYQKGRMKYNKLPQDPGLCNLYLFHLLGMLTCLYETLVLCSKHFIFRTFKLLCCVLCIKHACFISVTGLCLGTLGGMMFGIYFDMCSTKLNNYDFLANTYLGADTMDGRNGLVYRSLGWEALKSLGDRMGVPFNLVGAGTNNIPYVYHSLQDDVNYQPRVISGVTQKSDKPAGSIKIVRPYFLASELGIKAKTALILIAHNEKDYLNTTTVNHENKGNPDIDKSESHLTNLLLQISQLEKSLKWQFTALSSAKPFYSNDDSRSGEAFMNMVDGTFIFHNSDETFADILVSRKLNAANSNNAPVIGKILCFIRASHTEIETTLRYYYPHLLPLLIQPPSSEMDIVGDVGNDADDDMHRHDNHNMARKKRQLIPAGFNNQNGVVDGDDDSSMAGDSSRKSSSEPEANRMIRKFVRIIALDVTNDREYVSALINSFVDNYVADYESVFMIRTPGTFIRLSKFIEHVQSFSYGQDLFVGVPYNNPDAANKNSLNSDPINGDNAVGGATTWEDYCSLDAGFLLSQHELIDVHNNLESCLDDIKMLEKIAPQQQFQHLLGTCISQILQKRCTQHLNGILYQTMPYNMKLQDTLDKFLSQDSNVTSSNYTSNATNDNFGLLAQLNQSLTIYGLEKLLNNNVQNVSYLPNNSNDNNEVSTIQEEYALNHAYKSLQHYFTLVDLDEIEMNMNALTTELDNIAPQVMTDNKDVFFAYGVKARSKPRNHFDIMNWMYFNLSHVFLPTEVTSIAELTANEKLDVTQVVEYGIQQFTQKYPSLSFLRLVNGYKLVDTSRGSEYILDFDFLHVSSVGPSSPTLSAHDGGHYLSPAAAAAALNSLDNRKNVSNLIDNYLGGLGLNIAASSLTTTPITAQSPMVSIVSKRCHILKPLGQPIVTYLNAETAINYVKPPVSYTKLAAPGLNRKRRDTKDLAAGAGDKDLPDNSKDAKTPPNTISPPTTSVTNGNVSLQNNSSIRNTTINVTNSNNKIQKPEAKDPILNENDLENDNDDNQDENQDEDDADMLTATMINRTPIVIRYIVTPVMARDCPGAALAALRAYTSDDTAHAHTTIHNIDNVRLLLVMVVVNPLLSSSLSAASAVLKQWGQTVPHMPSLTDQQLSSLAKTYVNIQSQRHEVVRNEAIALKKSGAVPNLGWFTLTLPATLNPNVISATADGNNMSGTLPKWMQEILALNVSTLSDTATATTTLNTKLSQQAQDRLLDLFVYNGSISIKLMDLFAAKIVKKFGDDRYPNKQPSSTLNTNGGGEDDSETTKTYDVNLVTYVSVNARIIADPYFALARLNARRGRQVCFPIPYQRYDPSVAKPTYEGHDTTYRYQIHELKTSLGHYDTANWGVSLFYLSDYLDAREAIYSYYSTADPNTAIFDDFGLASLKVPWMNVDENNNTFTASKINVDSINTQEEPSVEWDIAELFIHYANLVERQSLALSVVAENNYKLNNEMADPSQIHLAPETMNIMSQARPFEIFRYVDPNIILEFDAWQLMNCPTLPNYYLNSSSTYENGTDDTPVISYPFAMTYSQCLNRAYNNVGTNVHMAFKIFESRLDINMSQYETIVRKDRHRRYG